MRQCASDQRHRTESCAPPCPLPVRATPSSYTVCYRYRPRPAGKRTTWCDRCVMCEGLAKVGPRESEFAQDSAGFGQTKFVETTRRGKTREWVQSVRLWPARMPICAAAVHSGLKHARENRGKAAGKKRQAQERVWLEAEATDCYAPERARTHTAQCARIAPADTRTARTPTRAHPRPPCTCRRRSRSMRPFSRSWRGRTG